MDLNHRHNIRQLGFYVDVINRKHKYLKIVFFIKTSIQWSKVEY